MHQRNAKKALTPTMTSVLLCVAIAVSLATLAWINGLPTSNMYTEDLQATNHQWGLNRTYVDVTIYNNGTQSVRLKSVTVNSQPSSVVYIVGSNQINKGESAVLRVANTFTPGATYQLAFQTAKGNRFVYTVTA
jgi:archaellum component FlaF (FlaF/FlaG flagellin family)